VHGARLLVFGLCALVAGPVTAVAGAVPFVGLIAPHALRALVGPLSRRLLPASFLAGAALVVVADVAARSLGEHVELLERLLGRPVALDEAMDRLAAHFTTLFECEAPSTERSRS
jgi:iron complex transport system permease protein